MQYTHWLRREAVLFGLLGGAGLLVLPALVFVVGQQLLGEYPDGGMGAFYADLYGHLGSASPWAWMLVLGPWLGVQFLRLLWWPMQKLADRNADEAEDYEEA